MAESELEALLNKLAAQKSAQELEDLRRTTREQRRAAEAEGRPAPQPGDLEKLIGVPPKEERSFLNKPLQGLVGFGASGVAGTLELPEVLSDATDKVQDAVEDYTGWRPELKSDNPYVQKAIDIATWSPWEKGAFDPEQFGKEIPTHETKYPILERGASFLKKAADDIAGKPQTAGEQGWRVAGEWLSPVGNKADKGLTGLKRVLSSLKPKKIETGAAIGAGVGSQVMEAVYGETGGALGELGGAATGALTAAASALVTNGRSFKDATKIISQIVSYAENPRKAAENLRAAVEKAVENGEELPGSLSQMTGDVGLHRAEELLLRANRSQTSSILDARENYADQITDEVVGWRTSPDENIMVADELRQGGTERIDEFKDRLKGAEERRKGGLQQTMARRQAEAQQEVAGRQIDRDAAEADLQTTAVPLESSPAVESSGKVLGEDLDTAFRTRKELETDPLYKKAREGEDLDPKEFKQVFEDTAEELGLGEYDLEQIQRYYGDQFNRILDSETPLKRQELMNVLSEATTTQRVRSNSREKSVVDQNAGDIIARLKKHAETKMPQYREARTAYHKLKEDFGGDKLRRAMASENPEEVVKKAGGWSGPSGSALARMVYETKDPKVISAAEETLRSSLGHGNYGGKSLSELTAARLTGLRKKHSGALERFPIARQQMDNVIVKRQILEEMERSLKEGKAISKTEIDNARGDYDRAVKALQAKMGGMEKTLVQPLRDFLDDPREELKAMLNSPDSLKSRNKLTSLHRFAKRAGVDEQFRQQYRLALNDILANPKATADAVSGSVNRYDVKALEKFDRLKTVLVESGVIDNKRAKEIRRALSRGADSSTLHSLRGELLSKDSEDALRNILASGAAAIFSPLLGSKQSLMVNGAIRRAFKAMLVENEHHPERLAAMAEYFSDPKKMETAILSALEAENYNVSSLARFTDRVFTPLKGVLRATAQTQNEGY